MAIYNEILVARFNRFAQKLFGIKGNAVIPQLAGDVSLGMQLFNGVENRFIEGWSRYQMFTQLAAVAAQNNAWALRNPLTSNMIAVIEQVDMLDGTAAQTFTQAITRAGVAGDLTNLGVGVAMDSRSGVNSVLIPSSANNVAQGALTVRRHTALLNTQLPTIFTDDQELVVLPGDRLLWTTSNVNTISVMSFVWRERFLEEGERT